MKWLVILLLLVNGGFFAWQYFGAPGHAGAHQASDAKGNYDPLTLISELSPEQRTALGVTPKDGNSATPASSMPKETEHAEQMPAQQQAPAAAEKPAEAVMEADKPATATPQPANGLHCYALGPMGNQRYVNQVKRRISPMGLTIDKIYNEVEKVPTNWIYLGPYKTESEAKRTLQRLHAKGLKDTQLINKGANNHVISVGLFSTKAGADERLKRLQDMGFTPSISQVTAKKSHYWLNVSYKGGEVVDEKILKDMVRGIRGAGVKETECKTR